MESLPLEIEYYLFSRLPMEVLQDLTLANKNLRDKVNEYVRWLVWMHEKTPICWMCDNELVIRENGGKIKKVFRRCICK